MPSVNVIECVKVGCQGWNYDDWVRSSTAGEEGFYPHGTRSVNMLEVYARAFETVEVDSTFYAIPPVSTVEQWARRAPEGFTFSLKLPQEITHERALRDGSDLLLAEFCERVRALKEKLAAVLIQLPPQFELTQESALALRDFLSALPRDMRFSIEFRHTSWMREKVFNLLARYNVSLALVEGQWLDSTDVWRCAEQPTADFAYVRWMGARNLTRFDRLQRPQDTNLRDWANLIKAHCAQVKNVYAYFSNYYEGHAPASANKLKRLLGQSTTEATDLEDQPSLF